MTARSGWQKSSFSGASGENCIEVRRSEDGGFLLREGDVPGTVLAITHVGLRRLIAAVKTGEFDRPHR
ncbi:DUF397 domain-containing protein [Streptomyces zingiberis]|uniref:DUF397 domain-containing protein n=1 Tax=Streptomyces zingiberis TaxID=2053010 RepID=A0ABX1BXW5_9ACTN|nr:DUF397 domain-containing protein [Streptomyces zingiberis]NJQ02537.1 DUF397 domain-containing protein [Streptomyces zingiberis]